MIFPLDGFVGKSDGEDLFYERMQSFLPRNYVTFHNQDIGMEEADVIMLVPNKGILVIEIKAFRPQNINKARDNKYILKSNGEVIFSPFKQAARYRDALCEKLKVCNPEYGKYVIAHVPCFTHFTEQDLVDKEMGKICDLNLFITATDIESFEKFSNRLEYIFECANKLNIPGLKRNYFPPNDIVAVGNIIMPNSVSVDDVLIEETETVQRSFLETKEYSHIYVKSDMCEESDDECKKIINLWKNGTKIFYYSNSEKSVLKIKQMLQDEISTFHIKNYSKKYDELNITQMEEPYGYFNFAIEYSLSLTESFEVINGIVDDGLFDTVTRLGSFVHFNAEQFFAEHADTKNMLVNAGAGTGKTYLLVSRIAYLTWKKQYSAEDLKKKIALITFTNDATDEMRSRLVKYFTKMFLLTFDIMYYEYVECVENMIISTIDSFSKKIVTRFSYNLGMGKDISVTSATLIKQKYVKEAINDYLKNEKKSTELAIPSYEMTKQILGLIKMMEDRNRDPNKIQELFDKSFKAQAEKNIDRNEITNYELVQKDLASMFLKVPSIMRKIEEECKDRNQILMGQIIVQLGRVVDLLKLGTIEKPVDVNFDFVFIDEFQDTDDQQIMLVAEFQKLFDFQLFVVGDVKQSIYRFRGANDDRAFSLLKTQCEDNFNEFNLVKNYRTNVRMLDYFDVVFKRLNSRRGVRKSKGLLAYSSKDVLLGVNNPDYPAEIENYYFSSEEERQDYICEIIKRHTPEKGKMAILVRKNHQVAAIKRICQDNESS